MTTYNNQHQYRQPYPPYEQRDPEPSIGDLFGKLSANASLLVKQEVQLAKAELSQKAAKAGREIAYVAVGGLLGYAALLTLIAGVVLLLGLWISLWLSALIVGLVLAVVGGLIAWKGIQALQEMDPTPTQTIATLQEDKEWLARQLN